MYSTFKTIQVFIQVFSRFFKGVKGLEKCLLGGLKKRRVFCFQGLEMLPVCGSKMHADAGGCDSRLLNTLYSPFKF